MSPEESRQSPQKARFNLPRNDAYKYQWSRYISRELYKEGLRRVERKCFSTNLPIDSSAAKRIAVVSEDVQKEREIGLIPPRHGHFKVGIVGAGAAGLFTALTLDWINDTIEKYKGVGKLKIDYEILEAATEDRFGGRLYTHRFSKDGTHDYYDVGAMRFPENDVMKRYGALGERTNVADWPVLIPYYLQDEDGVCPSYFNSVKKTGNAWDGTVDPFDLNRGIPEDKRIPDDLTKTDPSKLYHEALKPFVELVDKCFHEKNTPGGNKRLWALLRKGDRMSVRQYLLSQDRDCDCSDCQCGCCPDKKDCACDDCNCECCTDRKENPLIPGRSFSYNTIQWLETATYGTGWYDQSLTEAALEILDFEVPESKPELRPQNNYWWCIDGGAQKIAETMRKTLKDPSVIKYNTQVVGMDADIQLRKRVKKNMTLNLKDTVTGEALEAKSYFAVFNSTTLGATNRMDLSNAGLLWDTKQAIRCLNYGASCKVGIKFKTAWWRKEPFNINRGGIARTDLPLQVCVYPSYNIDNDLDPVDKPAVLLVSYTWGQTAQRLATLIASKSSNKSNEEILKEEEELKNLLLRDLAYLHAEVPEDPKEEKKKFRKALDLITGEYLEHHAYDWYHDSHMAGAFAYFGPCQFSELYPAITRPNALGQLYFVGEASSAHHAWVVGALESVFRALWSMFNILHQSSKDSGETYKPYAWAMQLLERGFFEDDEDPAYKEDEEETKKFYPSDDPEPSPFFPLPVEMPLRTDREAVEQDARRPDGPDGQSLWDHIDGRYPLMFGAACATLALLEYALDNWSGPGERREPVEPQPGNLGEGFPVGIEE
ncbi:hypothetical protein CGLO_06344 [Colletotrichum gloeosporioides Cg-14]|uniref:Amine oxidase domain-containing protein n=1 Tax=Colletotrichum gloeosporioides (strain Cg-14) TaxID=1237896 RepID=T0KPE2_COLGC|nr:hypothetical protein CGLO_06344 [Colletotrichum gloeosporioides Cg-14]